MQYCKFLILCEYLIPLFCIKARQYKIVITNFLLLFPIVQNRLKHKIEILISVRVASHDFMLKLIPCVWLGIYSNKMTLHVSWWSFKFFYNLLSEPTSFLSITLLWMQFNTMERKAVGSDSVQYYEKKICWLQMLKEH